MPLFSGRAAPRPALPCPLCARSLKVSALKPLRPCASARNMQTEAVPLSSSKVAFPDTTKVTTMIAQFARTPTRDKLPATLAPDDRELITRLGSGDDEAIGEMVDRWSEPFFAFTDAMRVYGREADDIIEEVFRRLAFDAPRLGARPERLGEFIQRTLKECAASVVARRSTVAGGTSPSRRTAGQVMSAAASPEVVVRCKLLLEQRRVADALEYLNSGTPFRFTGIYRVDGLTLTNLFLYDRENRMGSGGTGARLADTYCVWIQETLSVVQMSDSTTDPRAVGHPKREQVRSYCGGPIRDERGNLIGTICHFDFAPHAAPSTDTLPLLAAVGPLLARAIVS